LNQIDPSRYQTVSPLFKSQPYHTVLHTILAGRTPGWIYVDDSQSPAIGLAQFRHRVFLSGDPCRAEGPELGRMLMDEVI
jgi:hypothetical protein